MEMERYKGPCAEMSSQLSSFLDDELPEDEFAEVERHLAECAGCRAYVQDLRNLQSKLRFEMEEVFAPSHLDFDVWQQMSGLRMMQQESRLLSVGLVSSAGLAVLVLAGFISPLGMLLLGMARLMTRLMRYGWLLLVHLLQGQLAVVGWIAVVGVVLAAVASLALRWLNTEPSLGRS